MGQGALPSPQPVSNDQPMSSTQPAKPSLKYHSLYNQPDIGSFEDVDATSAKTALELAFLMESDDNFDLSEQLALPAIGPYLPKGTDPDAAKSLSALYRSHCTSLVECIRYCREKAFFHLYTSFQGTLTMPVQKLFGNPELAPWIEGCDLVSYQRMIKIISCLTLQVVPKPVLDTMRNISERLVAHIRESFQGQPHHVVRAKEAPATIFAGLLDRMLRVNLTAHAAANMLSNPANRDQMYVDWISMIRPRKMAECVPTRGMDDTVNLLVNEMRDLLNPVNVPWDVECLTIYGDVASRSTRKSPDDSGSGNGAENVLDRWVGFLRSLPEKFPYASHADIVWCVERVGTAVMRDLTLAQGKSFGSWWVTKTWVDEMVCFLAEQGGFMKQTMTCRADENALSSQSTNKEDSRQGSRFESGDSNGEVSVSKMPQAQLGRAPFPPANHGNQASNEASGGDTHDDSGIGIRTPEEDFPMEKFTFTTSETADLVTGTELAAGAGL
jgi:regulatory factor X